MLLHVHYTTDDDEIYVSKTSDVRVLVDILNQWSYNIWLNN